MKTPEHGDAYKVVRQLYDRAPTKSWSKLNGALQDALSATIFAGLSFLPEDFAAIAGDMKGCYWLGNSVGSVCGESYYIQAVKCGHSQACISFENYAGRGPFLWAEDVPTPKRLCIGDEITWGGKKLSITNMRNDKLIACAYGDYLNKPLIYFKGESRTLEDHVVAGDKIIIRLGGVVANGADRKVTSRVTITNEELRTARLAFEHRRKDILAAIAGSETVQSLEDLAHILDGSDRSAYRHFDLMDFSKAFLDRRTEFQRGLSERQLILSERDRATKWINGEPGHYGYLSGLYLRIRNGIVETSNGHSVTVASAAKALPMVLRGKRNGNFGPVSLKLDLYEVHSLSPVGLQVGCTLIPWSEIERIKPQLESSEKNV